MNLISLNCPISPHFISLVLLFAFLILLFFILLLIFNGIIVDIIVDVFEIAFGNFYMIVFIASTLWPSTTLGSFSYEFIFFLLLYN